MKNTNDSPLLQIKDLRHYYDKKAEVKVLDIPYFEFATSSVTGIIGENGSGKSTLLRLCAFLEKPRFGEILFKRADITPEQARKNITMLHQEPYLLKRSVKENILYGLRVRHINKELEEKMHHVLGWVNIDPDIFLKRQWFELSGGEKQRLALAARLILRPEIILLDEPTSSLDQASSQIIKEALLIAKKEWGISLIIVSHDNVWLDQISDQTVHLHKGQIIGDGRVNILTGNWTHSDNHAQFIDEDCPLISIAVDDFSQTAKHATIQPRDIKTSPCTSSDAGAFQVHQLHFNKRNTVTARLQAKKTTIWAEFAPEETVPAIGSFVSIAINKDTVNWF